MDLVQPATDWATANGPPNWVFVVALLTTPHLWASRISAVGTRLIDRYLGGGGK